ncbi:unnamed protein product [Absidia cylindrospora]
MSMQQVDALIDLANEKLLLYPYKDVPLCWRMLLMDASLLKALGLLDRMEQHMENSLEKVNMGKELIMVVDTALVVSGTPGNNRRNVSLALLNDVQTWLRPSLPGLKGRHLTLSTNASTLPSIHHPITTLHSPPDYLWFESHINETPMASPLHLQCGLMNHWPAYTTRSWTNIDYLLGLSGDRIVPVEIGSNYTDPSWQQKMMRMEDFINDYILPEQQPNRPPAYLAQHDLFHHIPILENDISVPDYCYVEPQPSEWYTQPAPSDVIKHAWFGPQGTVSPLHQDPYHNLLAQVVGRKYIRLYSPAQSDALYPHDGMMSNTSQVDLDSPNLTSYPRFAEAPYVECILGPGEMLYIPVSLYIKGISRKMILNNHPFHIYIVPNSQNGGTMSDPLIPASVSVFGFDELRGIHIFVACLLGI